MNKFSSENYTGMNWTYLDTSARLSIVVLQKTNHINCKIFILLQGHTHNFLLDQLVSSIPEVAKQSIVATFWSLSKYTCCLSTTEHGNSAHAESFTHWSLPPKQLMQRTAAGAYKQVTWAWSHVSLTVILVNCVINFGFIISTLTEYKCI